ncbi:MAG: DUF393 domain-containing protein [Verrucomicrobia bacterium]|nr:MAG: DUF393 domain-containing protein [Verrucomicrobiota bacterium]
MNTEITDYNAKPPAGWVFYDGECKFCVRGARRWSGLFARRGYHWLPLQTPRTSERLKLSERDLRDEMRLLLANGRVVGGVDAWIVLFRSVWWLWWLGALLDLPGLHWLGNFTYRWFAKNRYCFSGRCELERQSPTTHRHTTFFELP